MKINNVIFFSTRTAVKNNEISISCESRENSTRRKGCGKTQKNKAAPTYYPRCPGCI